MCTFAVHISLSARKLLLGMCNLQRFTPAFAFIQSDQSLWTAKDPSVFMLTTKTLIETVNQQAKILLIATLRADSADKILIIFIFPRK